MLCRPLQAQPAWNAALTPSGSCSCWLPWAVPGRVLRRQLQSCPRCRRLGVCSSGRWAVCLTAAKLCISHTVLQPSSLNTARKLVVEAHTVILSSCGAVFTFTARLSAPCSTAWLSSMCCCRCLLTFFYWPELQTDVIVTRAPGRLDVMGGIADYSGNCLDWGAPRAYFVRA